MNSKSHTDRPPGGVTRVFAGSIGLNVKPNEKTTVMEKVDAAAVFGTRKPKRRTIQRLRTPPEIWLCPIEVYHPYGRLSYAQTFIALKSRNLLTPVGFYFIIENKFVNTSIRVQHNTTAVKN